MVNDQGEEQEQEKLSAEGIDLSADARINDSKNAPHLESAITLGVFVQMFATANCSGGTPKKCQIIFYWIPVGKPSFDQQARLA